MADVIVMTAKETEDWQARARVAEHVADTILTAYGHLERECAAAHRGRRRNQRAFIIASIIAGLLAVALWITLMLNF